jgi:hypothetical protein
MSFGGRMSLPGGYKMPKGQPDALIAAASAILAVLITAGVTLYTTNKQIEAERQHSEKLQQQLDVSGQIRERSPKSLLENWKFSTMAEANTRRKICYIYLLAEGSALTYNPQFLCSQSVTDMQSHRVAFLATRGELSDRSPAP